MRTAKGQRKYPWRKRRRRFLAGVLICLTVVLGVPAILRLHVKTRLEAELEAIREAGYPATLEEAQAGYAEPAPGENAAELYQQAFKVRGQEPEKAGYQEISEAMEEEPERHRFSDAVRDMVRAYLAANQERLRLLHEAAKRPAARYPIDLSEGLTIQLPHLAQVRDSARLLRLEAMLAADEGDTALAMDAILAALAAGESLREEPIVISQLVRVACFSITRDALEHVLSVASFDEEQLGILDAAFARAEDPEAFARALATERTLGLWGYDHPEQLFADGGDPTLDRFVPGGTLTAIRVAELVGFQDRDRLRYVNYMNELIELSTHPTWEAIPEADRLVESIDDSLLPRVSQALVPHLTRTVHSHAQGLADLRCAQVAIAVERYRLVYGEAPERLDDLVPSFIEAVPTDPFDGAPLRYQTEGDGYLLYSVWRNQRDDGGRERAQGENLSQAADWVLRVQH